MAWVAHTIGLLPSGLFSIAQGTNSDGSVIVGVADSDGFGDGHAFWWTAGSGMVDLGVLSGGTQSIAYAVSADGQFVVGQSDGGTAPPGSTVAVLWHVTGGGATVTATELGYLGSGNSSAAFAISSDGTTIVGTSTIVAGDPLSLPAFPFRYVSGVMTNLGLEGANSDGISQAASSNGHVVAGGSNSTNTDVPWSWSSGGGLAAMALASGQATGAALALDAAGTAATGFSNPTSSSIPHAFLWNGSISSLIGEPIGDDQSQGEGMSADGTIIVGESGTFPTFSNAFYWTNGGGFVILPATGGTAAHAHAISGDGNTPVGSIAIAGQQIAAYWSQSSPITTVPLRHLRTFAVSPLPYLLPGGPSNSPTYSWMAATTDIPASASATLNDPSLPLELNGLQLDFLQQSQFVQANYGAAVNSANARTVSPPTAAASWNGQMATSDLLWQSGNVYAFTGAVAYPSTVAPTALSSTTDVLGFSSGTTAEYSPQPVLWEGTQYLILYARPQPDAEPRMLLGKADGTISWKTIWSGGSASGAANAPLWYEDQGGGNNFVLLGGDGSTVRPTLGLIPSAALGAETYSALMLDTPMYDAAFLDIAAASGPNTPLGQTVPGGWLLPTDDGYFIFLANDASFYDVYQFTGADPIGQQILSNAAGRFKTTNSRMFLTDVLVPFLIVPPATAIANAPDVTVLSYPPVIPASGGGGGLCGWRGLSGINWHGMALVGDKFSNVVGLSDFSIFREYGNGMQWLVTSPPVHSDRKRIFVPRFEIEAEAGLGLPDSPATAPQMVLDISKDGGETWQPLMKARSMGALGEYLTRLRWLRLGNARQWVFRLRYSDSARPALIGAYMDDIVGLG